MLKKRSSSSKLALIWLVVVVFFSGLLAKQFLFSAVSPIETNILKLLPENRQNPISEQAFQQVADNMSNQVVFVVSNPDAKQAITAAKSFESKLNELSLFNEIQGEISQDKQSKWAEFYFNHRAQLLTKAQIDELTTQPQNRVQYVLHSLYNPFLGVTSSELNQDPFLLFRDFLADLTARSGNFTLVDGYLTTTKSETTYVLITGELKGSPYQLSSQRQLPKLIDIENEITTQYGGDIIHTGVVFYADYGTQSAKSEVSTIGLGSLIGVVLLILIVFRSALPLSLAILSISSGLLVALAATIAIFGKVHLFSLVFGASLIGVSIDYAFHYLTDRLAAGKHWNSQQGLKHIFVAITLGLLTSLIGYLGLLIAPFPGLQQLALFSAIGLFSAYASVVCWYPILAQSPSQSSSLPAEKLWEKWLSLWKNPKFAIGLPLFVLLLGVLGLSQATYDDDIRQLQAMPQSLKVQETKIAELSGISNSQQMLLLTADSEQELLEKLALTTEQLQILANQKVITGHQSIDQYLPTIEQQQLNYRLLTTLYQDQGPTLQSTLGWQRTPSLTEFNPISVESFLASQVSEPIRFLWLEQINNQYASVIMLKSIEQPLEFNEWLQSDTATKLGVIYLNKAEDISDLFKEYRTNIGELLCIALAAIFVVLAIRYGWKHSVKMILPSLIAGIAALAITTVLGSSLNLFNLLGLILILGIGIDYTLFFSEQKQTHSTLLAITLSALTTLLSFGLLALSQTHAIHSFGLTVLTGIFVAWLLAPMANQSTRFKR